MATQKIIRVAPNRWHEKDMPTPRVLLVADNWSIQTDIKHMLGSSGYEVFAVGNKPIGWDEISTTNYAAAIVDLDTSTVDGITLIQRFRYLFPSPYLPIIAITTNEEFSAKREAADAGADAFLNKPIGAEELLGTIIQLFNLVTLSQVCHATPLETESKEINFGLFADFRKSSDRHALITAFEIEMQRLMEELTLAIETNCLSEFLRTIAAIKELAQKVGASRLVAACIMTEELEQSQRNGEQILKNIRVEFYQAVDFLRKLFEISNLKSG